MERRPDLDRDSIERTAGLNSTMWCVNGCLKPETLKASMDFLDAQDQREYQVSWQGRSAVVRLQVEERFRYTSTVMVSQQMESDSRWLDAPQLLVRLYHDAAMAEVICIRQRRQLSGRYPYPNPQMHQPDEKAQLNDFLGECLNQCLDRKSVV